MTNYPLNEMYPSAHTSHSRNRAPLNVPAIDIDVSNDKQFNLLIMIIYHCKDSIHHHREYKYRGDTVHNILKNYCNMMMKSKGMI